MTTYLDDATYERRRRRRIATLITAGALLLVATDVTAAVQWATGARSAGDSVSTLLFSVAVAVAVTWQFTHPAGPACGWHVGGVYAAVPELTPPDDEGGQR